MDLLRFTNNLKLKYKLALCFCGLIVLTLSSFWLVAKIEINQNLQQQADGLGNTLAEQAANSVKELVLTNDLLSLNVILDQLTRNKNILNVSVFNIDGQLLASSGTTPKGPAKEIIGTTYSAQISLQNAIAGTAQLQLNNSAIVDSMKLTSIYFWSILGLGLVLTTAIAFTLTLHFTTPILELIETIQNTDEKYLPEEVQSLDIENSNEIDILRSVCLHLLKHHKDNAQAQLNLNKTEEAHPTLDNKPLKIMTSILVVKVVNINTAIELLHPSTLSALLNEYIYYLRQAAKLYGGNIQRISGESVMLSFDARQSNEDHSFNAVCCAQLFLMLMSQLNQQHRSSASQALEFRLGIHSGETFIATSTTPPKETFVGKAVEISYFLCNQSKPGQLLISEATYSQSGGESQLSSKGSTEITMPTDNMSFMAYSVDVKMKEHTDLLNKQHQHILSGEKQA